MSETVQRAAAEQIGKHRQLLRSGRDGRILSGLMLPLLRWAPPTGYGVLTTTGRNTGKPRRRCVRVIRCGDRAYLVALRPPYLAVERPNATPDWVWDIRANFRVRLRIRGQTFDGIAREVTEDHELSHARAAICDPVYNGDFGECWLHLRGLPSRAKVQQLHRYWFDTGIPVVIDLKATRP
jgi:deazaflavin-dependent oxidoreductase (nitroreductase family)